MPPPFLHCNPTPLSQESPLRSGGRSPGAPERAGVTGACGFINKYLSVCCSNEQGSNLKWSQQPPGMQTSGTACLCQSNVKVHQQGTSSLPAPILTDVVLAAGRGWIRQGGDVTGGEAKWGSSAPLWPGRVTSGVQEFSIIRLP